MNHTGWTGLIFRLVRIAHAGAELAAINAMRQYVKTLNVARRIVQVDLAIHLLSGLALGGFILLHVALFMGWPWAQAWLQAMILAIISFVYMVTGLVALLLMGSSRLWVKGTGVGEMVEGVELHDDGPPPPPPPPPPAVPGQT